MLYPVNEQDIPAVNEVFRRLDYEYLNVLIKCVSVSIAVNQEYPVEEASQLEKFLAAMGHDVAWFEELFAWMLPIKDKGDFILKARVAAQKWLILNNSKEAPSREDPGHHRRCPCLIPEDGDASDS